MINDFTWSKRNTFRVMDVEGIVGGEQNFKTEIMSGVNSVVDDDNN
jgi:hypothetical protein